MRLGDLGLYFHTLRYLRPSQLFARAWRVLRRPSPDARAAPPLRPRRADFAQSCPTARNLLDEHRFEALGECHDIAATDVWNDTRHSALWLYNLHYFDDLNSEGAVERRKWHQGLLRRWVLENPPAAGIGWHSYPVSRRIINWIKWALREPAAAAGIRDSLAVQTRWLMQRLEIHLGGNHLLANAKALLFAGCYFGGAEGARWLERGMHLMSREIDEQVLADGGHFERSPMYHAAVLEDLLDCINMLRAAGLGMPPGWQGTVTKMLTWLEALSHPDGEVAFFNDSAFGIAPTREALAAYARRLDIAAPGAPRPLAVLEPSGYLRASMGDAWLACDCGPVGPDYLPGHAHADTLSFEFTLGSDRLLVNSGTSLYGIGAERHRQRGTAAHNTVSVDDADSSEVWAGFRVARRARARLTAAAATAHEVVIEGGHDGYRRLPGRNRHARRWLLERHSLRIRDEITGGFRRATAHFHFHPDVEVRQLAPAVLQLSRGGTEIARLSLDGAEMRVSRGSWHPRFGASLANWQVSADFASPVLESTLTWNDAR